MICYKDRTFCIAQCSADCNIKVTPELEKEADEFGLPLAVANFSDECDNYKEIKDEYKTII